MMVGRVTGQTRGTADRYVKNHEGREYDILFSSSGLFAKVIWRLIEFEVSYEWVLHRYGHFSANLQR
jgi:hypothetical protein